MFPYHRTKSNQRWMKLRTTVQLSGAITSTNQKPKPPLKREDSFLKRFSTRQIPETQVIKKFFAYKFSAFVFITISGFDRKRLIRVMIRKRQTVDLNLTTRYRGEGKKGEKNYRKRS